MLFNIRCCIASVRAPKRTVRISLLCVLFLSGIFLAGCSEVSPQIPSATEPEITTASSIAPETTTIETTPAETTLPPETQPPHSSLYIPGIPVEDVIGWFNEVCLDAEITNSGNPKVVQKWTEPIVCCVLGSPTSEDLATLDGFLLWLNALEGFPGIRLTETEEEANLRFHFCSTEEMLRIMGENFSGMDGAVTFWYQHNAIYDAVICCRTGLDQTLRNSVILEELYNGLGPIQDTALRTDSIIYSGYSEPQSLTAIDELLLKLLYHPQLKCGMDAHACETIIRQLYH